ncbi:hypothetical protein Hanom_Chr14g01263021 [Helianthus anomalus]
MKAKRSLRSRRPLEVLRVREAAVGLLLLANSPSLVLKEKEKPFNAASSVIACSDYDVRRQKDVVDEGISVLDADGLTARFPMIRKGGCQLVYHRRKNRRCGQVPIVDDDPDAG